jgi:hypothetical protein
MLAASSPFPARSGCSRYRSGIREFWQARTSEAEGLYPQHEALNWFCLLGALEALGRKQDKAVFLENWAFVSPVVLAHYHA